MIYESGEDYLETILLLQRKNGSVRSIEIAAELGYTKASVSRAMELAGAGDPNASQAATLTDGGNSPSDSMQLASSQQGAMGGNPELTKGA